MRIYKLALLLAAFSALMGCATPTPPQLPPTEGIFSVAPPKSKLNNVVGGHDQTLLLVLSKNTIANLEYLKSMQEARKKELIGYRSVIDAHIEALDPQFPTKWIVKSLKAKFGQVKLVSASSIASQKGYDSLVIVDFFYQTTDWGINHATARVETEFYDRELNRIGSASANKRVQVRSGAPVSDDDLFLKNHQVLISTLQDWDVSLNRLVLPEPAQANPAATPNRDACIRSALQVTDGNLRQSAIAACSP